MKVYLPPTVSLDSEARHPCSESAGLWKLLNCLGPFIHHKNGVVIFIFRGENERLQSKQLPLCLAQGRSSTQVHIPCPLSAAPEFKDASSQALLALIPVSGNLPVSPSVIFPLHEWNGVKVH